MEGPTAQPARTRRRSTRVRWIWVITGVMGAGVVVATVMIRDAGSVHASVRMPWWALAIFFYFAEMAVLHLRFRRDAYSFSMSEVPLVLGLAFASPLALVLGQVIGNAVVLSMHRRQVAVKYAFNLAQFGIQSLVAVGVYRAVLGSYDPLGPVGWGAAFLGAIAALVVADLLINAVIRISGGSLSLAEIVTVLSLSVVATAANSSLGLVAGIVFEARPEAALLGLAPGIILFFAYRAYVAKREEGARFEALYDATRALHASPQIESSMAAATAKAKAIFDAEFAEIVLFPSESGGPAYRTTTGPGDRSQVMRPAHADAITSVERILAGARHGVVREGPPHPLIDGRLLEVKDAIAAPLAGSSGVVGAILAINRLGDVSSFDLNDVRMLETIANQVGVSLENGRLEDSLAELTELKERLEELVRSKDEFVASVSHELRTPLTAVFGLAEELRIHRDAFSDGELAEFISVIAEQSHELSDMVEDLLVAARADIGTLNLAIETIEPMGLLTDLIGSNPTLDAVVGEIRGSVGPVDADPMRTRQIVRNLITNAERYGGDKVWLELREQGPDRAVIAVVDDGDGVPDGSEESIFDAYERAHNAVGQPSSVGLGLAVSRRLAQLMGGDLAYRREYGLTLFELILPRSTGV